MKALVFAVLAIGLFVSSVSDVLAQQAATSDKPATSVAPSASNGASGQTILTPEQIENLEAMVDQMRSKMNEMVRTAREAAGRMADGTQTVVLSTDQLAAIAIGAVGGALVIDFLGGGGMASIAGAVLGGVGAHWLVSAPLPPAKTATMR
ncbi:MAG: hypothetical protein HQ481_06845 [Alphaproteobacteria bacterium]|nr:hypothetical protein [Alphaproteobacteria bacterium]